MDDLKAQVLILAGQFDTFSEVAAYQAEIDEAPDWYVHELAGRRTTWTDAANHLRDLAAELTPTPESDKS